MKLSANFTLEQMVASDTAARKGIENTPTPEVVENLRGLVTNILEPLQQALSIPLIVTSGYRCLKLNKAIGSADTSQHIKGQAADIISPYADAETLFKFILAAWLPFDQLINEFGQWVHVSWTPTPRGQVLLAKRIGGKVQYIPLKENKND